MLDVLNKTVKAEEVIIKDGGIKTIILWDKAEIDEEDNNRVEEANERGISVDQLEEDKGLYPINKDSVSFIFLGLQDTNNTKNSNYGDYTVACGIEVKDSTAPDGTPVLTALNPITLKLGSVGMLNKTLGSLVRSKRIGDILSVKKIWSKGTKYKNRKGENSKRGGHGYTVNYYTVETIRDTGIKGLMDVYDLQGVVDEFNSNYSSSVVAELNGWDMGVFSKVAINLNGLHKAMCEDKNFAPQLQYQLPIAKELKQIEPTIVIDGETVTLDELIESTIEIDEPMKF